MGRLRNQVTSGRLELRGRHSRRRAWIRRLLGTIEALTWGACGIMALTPPRGVSGEPPLRALPGMVG